jgi:hypothetical protein
LAELKPAAVMVVVVAAMVVVVAAMVVEMMKPWLN